MCGPGVYVLTELNLALSLPRIAGVPSASVPLVVTLFRANNATYFPEAPIAVMLVVPTVTTTPEFFSFPLAATFRMDLSDGHRHFALAFHPAQARPWLVRSSVAASASRPPSLLPPTPADPRRLARPHRPG